MKTSKLQKISKRIKRKAIQALLYISEDEFDITKRSFFNCLKIVIYFLQLEGYIFSQYESKPLRLRENIYLSNYTQLSSITFFLFQIGNDLLTQLFFYLIFVLHIIVYISLASLSLDKQIQKTGIIKKMLNLFFTNYQWIFVTPFQEISVGVMVCGENAFIKNNQYDSDCQQTKNQFLYVFGTISTIFIFISGFSISYFFRNYQFNDRTFSRKFNYITIFRILLHQIVIILYYINFNNIDYAKHAVSQIIGLTLILDILFNQPFGFTFESRFYSAATLNHHFLLVLSALWIFKSKQNDEFIFFAFIIFIPINTFVSGQYLRLKQLEIYNNFNTSQFSKTFDKQLEEIYRVAESSEYNPESKLLLYQIFKHHISNCKDNKCLCMQNVKTFFIHNQIDYNILNQWSTILFQKQLAYTLIQKDFQYYEHLALKFVTFLAKYQNNPINAYLMLQKIMSGQQSQNLKQINSRKIEVSFYFQNIYKILLRRNRNQFINQQLRQTKKVESLLQGQAQIENYGTQITDELIKLSTEKQQFWENYMNSKIVSLQGLDDALNRVHLSIQAVTYLIKQLSNKTKYLNTQKNDCVSILNFELLFKICTTNNNQEIYQIQQKIKSILLADQYEEEQYLNIHFQTKQCISLIANISQNKRGELFKPNQKLLQKFFNKNREIVHLNQLLPNFIVDVHNGIIENFIQNGKVVKTQLSTQVFSTFGENDYIEPVNLNLRFFFPVSDYDNDFQMIGFIKKEVGTLESTQNEKQLSGYICFDENLNVLGINQVVAEKLNYKSQSCNNYNGLDICIILPTILPVIIELYKSVLIGKINNLVDDEMIVSKNQDVFYIPDEFYKNYQIDPNDSLVDKINKFEEIYINIKQEQYQQLTCHQVNYQLFSKRLKYITDLANTSHYKEFFLIKLQFLEQNQKSENNNNIKTFKEYRNQNTELNFNNFDGILEIMSSKTKSSTRSVLQQIEIFHNLLTNQSQSKHQKLFKIMSIIFLVFFVITSIIVSLTFKDKNNLFKICKIEQIHKLNEVSIYSSLINSINNEGIIQITEPNLIIQLQDASIEVSDAKYKQIQSELIDYSSFQFFKAIQEVELIFDLPNNFSMKYIQEFDNEVDYNEVQNLLTFRQILSQNIENYKSYRKKQDLSIIVLNYFNYVEFLQYSTQSCQEDSKLNLNQAISLTQQILIVVYVFFSVIYILQIFAVNRMLQSRKYILKLFVRTDFKEALLENEKFQILQTWFIETQQGWSQKNMTRLLNQLNLSIKNLKDEDEIVNGLTQSDKKLNEKGERLLDNSEKQKVNFSHKYQNFTGYITITTVFFLSIIYLLSFHIQMTYISEDLLYLSSFSLFLSNYQINYLMQYFRCQYYMNYQFYNHLEKEENKQIMAEIYQQIDFTQQNLEENLMYLNRNVFSSILTNSEDTQIDRILNLNEQEQAEFFKGNFCWIDEQICNESNRNITLHEDLQIYYNSNLNQLFFSQGQIFYESNEIYDMEELIKVYVQNLLNSQEYFLNNVWGFDIIIERVSKIIIYFLERMDKNIGNSEKTIFFYALLIGLSYFVVIVIAICILAWYLDRQDQKMKQCLFQMPFTTIIKKNIFSCLKYID